MFPLIGACARFCINLISDYCIFLTPCSAGLCCLRRVTHVVLKPCFFLSLCGTSLWSSWAGEPNRSHSSHPLFPLMSKASCGRQVRDSMGAPTHAHARRSASCVRTNTFNRMKSRGSGPKSHLPLSNFKRSHGVWIEEWREYCVCLCVSACVWLKKGSGCWTIRGAVIKISPGLSQLLSPLLKT